MKILQEMLKFPIVMIDMTNEERKEKIKGLMSKGYEDDSADPDLIIGEAMVPHWDFLCINDRWLPSTSSMEKAQDGKFEACAVTFVTAGTYLVPMPKKDFLKLLTDFENSLPKPKQTLVRLTKKQAADLAKEIMDDQDKE